LGRLIRRLETVGAGDIVLLHDGYHGALGAERGQTVEALQHWLPRWKNQGFDFVAIERSA
jgi:peptidoglycan/xylan/chitin deacetylase (PgdA/CDA1 family)